MLFPYLFTLLLAVGLSKLINRFSARPWVNGWKAGLIVLLVVASIDAATTIATVPELASYVLGYQVGSLMVPMGVAAFMARRFERAKGEAIPA